MSVLIPGSINIYDPTLRRPDVQMEQFKSSPPLTFVKRFDYYDVGDQSFWIRLTEHGSPSAGFWHATMYHRVVVNVIPGTGAPIPTAIGLLIRTTNSYRTSPMAPPTTSEALVFVPTEWEILVPNVHLSFPVNVIEGIPLNQLAT